MTCPKPGCTALVTRVETCQEFRIIRHRWVCHVGHSGFLEDDLPDYGRPVEPWGTRGGRPRGQGVPCGECHKPLPSDAHPQREFHAECAALRNARSTRAYDARRQAERRSPAREMAEKARS